MGEAKPNIFTYKEYRKFIKNFVSFKKNADPKFSMVFYSKRIGYSESYLKLVLSGQHELNINSAMKLAKAFRLNGIEQRYLVNLVLKESASNPALKRYFEDQLLDISRKQWDYSDDKKYATIFYDSLMWEVQSLVAVEGFSSEPRWIANHLTRQNPDLSAIKRCFERLLEMEAIAFENGKFVLKEIVIEEADWLNRTHVISLRRAIAHLENSKSDDGSAFDSFCLVINETDYAAIKEVLENTKFKIAQIVRESGRPKTHIAQFNSSIFLASK